MSYIMAKGKAARKMSEENSKDYSKLLTKIPGQGQSPLVVKLMSDEDYVLYAVHSAYKKFYTTPCTKVTGKEDLYDKAADIMFEDIRKELEAGKITEDEAKEKRKEAAQLLPKNKYLLGFLNLDDGQPIVVEVTENQGNAVIDAIDKNIKHKDTFAFELYKTGSSTNTVVNLSPVLDMDDLSKDQKKNFDKAVKDQPEFDAEAFGKLFNFKDEAGQAEDLVKFGFDVSRLGIDPKNIGSDSGADDQGEEMSGEQKAEQLF